jgi:hypothetical protein
MSEMTSTKIVLPVEVDAEDFWSHVLGSAWESWSWWQRVEYSAGADWDKVGEVTVTIDDPEADWDEETDSQPVLTKTLTLEDLAASYAKCLAEGYKFNLDDLDACDGDVVMQMAVLGEVTYG